MPGPQTAFDTLTACLLNAPILGFLMEEGRFILDTDASLFAVVEFSSSSRTIGRSSSFTLARASASLSDGIALLVGKC